MLFRKSDGTLIEINRYDYKNDIIYYKKIKELFLDNKLNIKNLNSNPTQNPIPTSIYSFVELK